jgi:hypothetical protein
MITQFSINISKEREMKTPECFDKIIDIIKNNPVDDKYVIRTSEKQITTINIIKNSILTDPQNFLLKTSSHKMNGLMIMAYCKFKKKHKIKDNEFICWKCDKPGTKKEIFNYDTIFKTPVKLCTPCFFGGKSHRKNRCTKIKVLNDYNCLLFINNRIIIYNNSKLFYIEYYDYVSIQYKMLNDRILEYVLHSYNDHTINFYKSKYTDLMRQEFIDKNLNHYLLMKNLIMNDVATGIIENYIKLLLLLSNEDYDTLYNILYKCMEYTIIRTRGIIDDFNIHMSSITDILKDLRST